MYLDGPMNVNVGFLSKGSLFKACFEISVRKAELFKVTVRCPTFDMVWSLTSGKQHFVHGIVNIKKNI